jgi:hypothetical protein
MNPSSPFHYLKVEYIDKAEEKNILHLHFEIEDNLTMSKTIIARYKRMYTGVFYSRFILGLWCQADGIIYESHQIPEKAYSDGQQTLDFAQSARLASWIRQSFAMRKNFDLL